MDKQHLREVLASVAHEQWSGWMEYLFSHCTILHVNGPRLVIPEWAEGRWKRQMQQHYINLPEDEQESDLIEADKFLKYFDEYANQTAIEALERAVAVIDRKKEFYTGAHGDHWEGYISCLDTLREEYTQEIAKLKG